MDKINKILYQIFKFGVVGGFSFIIDYSIFVIMVEVIGIYYLLSAAASFVISTIFNYIFSMLWVFDVKDSVNKQKTFVFFIILSTIGLGINQIVMYFCVDKFNMYYLVAKLIATFIVMIWNFTTKKFHLEERR